MFVVVVLMWYHNSKITKILYFVSEIVLPENLQEEFPNPEALDIFGGKPTIETKRPRTFINKNGQK